MSAFIRFSSVSTPFLSLVDTVDDGDASPLVDMKGILDVAYLDGTFAEAQSVINRVHDRSIPEGEWGVVADALKWTVCSGVIKCVTGLHFRWTSLGIALVVDDNGLDPEGTAFACKEMPVVFSKGPPL